MEDDQNWIDTAVTMFEPAPQSIADTLLAKVFGNWVLGDASGRGLSEGPLIYNNFLGMDEVTLISSILGFSGILAAAFGIIISSYTFLMQMVKNSWNGTFASDGVNSIFWPLRSVAAFALIIPVVSIGDSETGRTTQIATSQVMMMDIARMGSGFGDTVAAAYVTNAFAFPISNHRPPDTPDAVFDMVSIASCAVIGAHTEGDDYVGFGQIATAIVDNDKPTTHIALKYVNNDDVSEFRQEVERENGEGKRVQTHETLDGALSAAFATQNLRAITFGKDGMCGRITFEKSNQTEEGSGTSDQRRTATVLSNLQNGVRNAYYPAYESLAKLMFNYVDDIIQNDRLDTILENSTRLDAAASDDAVFIHQSVIAFNQDLYDNVSAVIAAYRDQLGGTMFGPIIDGGWAALGAVYSVMPRISNLAVNNIADAHSQIAADPTNFPCVDGGWFSFDDCEAKENALGLTKTLQDLAKKYRTSFNNSERNQISVLDFCSIDQCSARSIESSVAKTASTFILQTLAEQGQIANRDRLNGDLTRQRGGWTNANTENSNAGQLGDRNQYNTQDPNPITTLSAIGSSLNFLGTILQLSQIKLATIGSVIEGMKTSNSVVVNTAGIALSWIQTTAELAAGFILSISTTFLISGFFLSYVLPMIPFMIFSMQVVGWLATTAEGMFAVTFAVSLLTNSDGDGAINTGFLKALSLTAAIFLKPFFIVVGVGLSNAIAAPAFSFFVDQYWLAWDLDDALGGTMSNVVFEMSAQLIMFIIGAGILVKFIYSIQHIVPDSMNNWISGGIVNPFGVQGVADNVQADIKGGASEATKAGSDSIQNVVKKNSRR